MNINDLTIGQAKELAALFGATTERSAIDNGMAGKYVIVRCRDAGVHAGVLESYNGRDAVLTESRRLWYWKCEKGAFLSGAAVHGLSDESKLGVALSRIHLTETCEIIECSATAEISIRSKAGHNE